jgi:DNA recombination protein RmuC
MFIPSEAIYYDLLIDRVGAMKSITRDLIDYAYKERRVIIVSPTTFLAYLQMVIQGLRSLQIEESAKEIQKNVEELGKRIIKYDAYLEKLGQNLSTAVGAYNLAHKEFERIDKNVVKIINKEELNIKPLAVESPQNRQSNV